MNLQALAFLGVRLFGLYFLAQGFLEFPNLLSLPHLAVASESVVAIKVAYAADILAPTLLGCLFLLFSTRISQALVPRTAVPDASEDRVIAELRSLAFAALGLFIVFLALPNLLRSWIAVHQLNAASERQISYVTDAQFLFAATGVVYGLLLFIGVRFWARLYVWFREFGLEEKK